MKKEDVTRKVKEKQQQQKKTTDKSRIWKENPKTSNTLTLKDLALFQAIAKLSPFHTCPTAPDILGL